MKLSAETIDVLKNFSTINPSILVHPGNVLYTCTPKKNMYAKATVKETFPKEFGIYELNRFLGAISVFPEYELKFTDKTIKIISENNTLNYTVAEPDVIIYPSKELNFPASAEIEFNVKQENLQKIIRAGSVLQLPDVVAIGKNGRVQLKAMNIAEEQDEISVDVGETDKTFTMVFHMENIIKLISSNYNVKISSMGIAKFVPSPGIVDVYYIATEKNSKMGE